METAETLSAFLDELNKASPEMAEYIAGLAEELQQASQEHVSNNDQTEQQIAERAEGINQQEADQLLAKEVTLPELVFGESEAPPMPDKTFEQQQGEFGALRGLLNDYYAESQQYADQNLEAGINRGIYAASKNEGVPAFGSDIDFDAAIDFYQGQRESAYSGLGLEADAPEGHTGNYLGWKVASIGNESLQFLQFLGESSQSATLAGAVAGLFLPKPEYISLVGEGSLLGKPQSFAGAVGVESGVIDSYFIGAEGLVAFGFKLGAKSAGAASKGDGVADLSSTSRVDFYVKPDGTTIPGTGYRYVSSESSYLPDLNNSKAIPANSDGTYFSFDKYDQPAIASERLQVPHDASIRLEFDTKQILDDVRVPYGNWGKADHLEPITTDFKQFGDGGATQAITNQPIILDKIEDLRKKNSGD